MKPLCLQAAVYATFLIVWAVAAAAQTIETAFSPRGGIHAAIIKQIAAAETTVDVAAYYFTSRPLAEALIEAKTRHVKIRCVLDRTQEAHNRPTPRYLFKNKIPIRTDRIEKIHHNKYAIIDQRTVITGSANWSKSAEERNAENIVILHDPKTAAAFAADFQRHWNHSTQFVPRPGPASATQNPNPGTARPSISQTDNRNRCPNCRPRQALRHHNPTFFH